jgi:alpha-beta hydrolase superfamily lysophospholipase
MLTSRRALIAAAGATLGLRGLSAAGAQTTSAGTAPVWSAEYSARKGAVSLAMFRKRRGEPRRGRAVAPGAVPRARLVDLLAPELRPHGARPRRVLDDRLVLSAFTWTGQGSPTLAKRREGLEYFRTHNRRPRERDMIRSIFTRDKTGTADPAVAEALADAELPFGDTIPTGTYLDMTANLPVVDPTRVKAPVLMVRGEHDGIATEDDLLAFYRRLPNADRQFVVLAGAAHSLGLGVDRQQLWHVVRAFLETPARDRGQDGGQR